MLSGTTGGGRSRRGEWERERGRREKEGGEWEGENVSGELVEKWVGNSYNSLIN